MVLEPLAIAIRANNELRGIQIGKDVMKLGMCEDDVVCYLSNPVVSMRLLNQVIEEFSPLSGCKINPDKSVLCRFNLMGIMKQEIVEILPGKWQNEDINYLGIRICRTNETMVKKCCAFTDFMCRKNVGVETCIHCLVWAELQQ